MSTEIVHAYKYVTNDQGKRVKAEETFPRAVWLLLSGDKNGWKVAGTPEADEKTFGNVVDDLEKAQLHKANESLQAKLAAAEAALAAATTGKATVTKVTNPNAKPPVPPVVAGTPADKPEDPAAPADQTPAGQ